MEPLSDFVITSTITYRPHRIPPRCRKPRPVAETFTHEFRIPCLAPEAAPVVALVPDDHGYLGAAAGQDAPLRAYNGQLYSALARDGRPIKAGSGAFPATVARDTHEAWQDDAIREAGNGFKDLLIIDGGVWKPAKEPVYSIVTLGMGDNHGGTHLEIDYAGRYVRQFPLTDYDAAVEAAVAFAEKRGDTHSIPLIRQAPKATILDPTAFKVSTGAERRAAAEEAINALLTKARTRLAGTQTRMTLREVRELLDEAGTLMSESGIEEMAATGA